MKKLCVLFVLFSAFALTFALGEDAEPMVYSWGSYEYILLEDGTAEITYYDDLDKVKDVVIPAEIDGRRVTSINGVFYSYWMETVTIPDSIVTIKINPFQRVIELREIRVSDSHPTLSVIDGVLFDKNRECLICYPVTLAETYEIPYGTREIGKRAFANTNLSRITIPDTVTKIGENAFFGCKGLKTLYVPDSVTELEGGAFAYCCNLEVAVLGDGIEALYEGTFECCCELKSLTISERVTSIDWKTFMYANPVLLVHPDSYAEKFAIKYKYTYLNVN